MTMRKASADGDEQSAARLALLTQALAGVFHAAAMTLQPSVFQDMVCRVGVQLGRQAATLYRLTYLEGRWLSRTLTRRLEWIGRQFGWNLLAVQESDELIRITVLECPFARPGESDPYLCELASGIFGGVVADERSYAKVCTSHCPEVSPLQCSITICLRQSEASRTAPGIVYPLGSDEERLGAKLWPGAGPGERLTPRETEVLRLIAQGLADKEIAATLGLSVRTVENHAARVREKLGLSGRTALVRFALRTRLVDL